MPRPKQATPTAGELEILQVLWKRGTATVRDVADELSASRPRAYTSVMTLLNVMADKGLVTREPQGRAFLYRPARTRDKTLRGMVKDLLARAFDGSTSALVAQLLQQTRPSADELAAIRQALDEYQQREER